MVDYPTALAMFVNPSRTFVNQNSHKWVCIHKSAGLTTIEELANYFQINSDEVSSHYGVGQDGRVGQFVPEKDGSAANCCTSTGHVAFLADSGPNNNYNWYTLTIEHLDPAKDNSTPLTDAQKQASFSLVYYLCQKYAIPMRAADVNGGILFHHDLDPVNRSGCPGNYPYDELWSYLKNMQDIQSKLIALQKAYNIVVTEKNQLIQTNTTLTEKHIALENAYNTVVAQKNALIASNTSPTSIPTIVQTDIKNVQQALEVLLKDTSL
jgi:N-acetyl-anhydromuramyl-L-alanine amidase AmpD